MNTSLPKALCLAVASAALLAACGGSSSGSSSSPRTGQTSVSGSVVDGYVANADVCYDLNINSVCDAGEPSAKSGADGGYTFDATTTGGYILATGGTNRDTDLPNTLTMRAPATLATGEDNAVQITPITTLVTSIAGSNASAADVTATLNKIQTKLDLPAGFDPLTQDPIEVANASSSSSAQKDAALDAFKRGVQIANIATSAQSISTEPNTLVGDRMFDGIEQIMSDGAGNVDLTNAGQLEVLLKGATGQSSIEQGVIDQLSSANEAVENSASTTEVGAAQKAHQEAVRNGGDTDPPTPSEDPFLVQMAFDALCGLPGLDMILPTVFADCQQPLPVDFDLMGALERIQAECQLDPAALEPCLGAFASVFVFAEGDQNPGFNPMETAAQLDAACQEFDAESATCAEAFQNALGDFAGGGEGENPLAGLAEVGAPLMSLGEACGNPMDKACQAAFIGLLPTP